MLHLQIMQNKRHAPLKLISRVQNLPVCVLVCLSKSLAYLAANLHPSITQGKARRFFLAIPVDPFDFLMTTTFEGLMTSFLAGDVVVAVGIDGAAGWPAAASPARVAVGAAEFEGSLCQK